MATPQGISTIKAPHLNSTLFMYSPNCRLAIGIKDGEGMKREKFYAKAVNYAGMAGTVSLLPFRKKVFFHAIATGMLIHDLFIDCVYPSIPFSPPNGVHTYTIRK